ncbi:MAG: hypothetical protein IKW31_04260 [Alistipes sp.]|nr:hypothetical protein [Alistipes sp.]
MKRSWEKIIYVIFVPIYLLSLYLAIKFPGSGLWPFIMLNIGAMTSVPHIIRMIRKEDPNSVEQYKDEEASGRKYWKYLLAYISSALVISLAIDMFLDEGDNIGYIGVLVIFASILVAFIITDIALVVVPKHKHKKEEKEENADNYDNE